MNDIKRSLHDQWWTVDDASVDSQPPTRSARSSNYPGNPDAILIPYALNPYYTGPYQQQQQPNTPIIPDELLEPTSRNVSDVEDGPATSPQSKQQNIACGVGPSSSWGRNTRVGRIFGGTESDRNAWPFMVNTDMKWQLLYTITVL